MRAEQAVRVGFAETTGDDGTPIPTLRDVARIAELLHQLGHGVGDAVHAEPRRARRTREAVARHRGTDHVEGVARVAAVRLRIRERTQDLVELEDRARPSVGHDEGQGVLDG